MAEYRGDQYYAPIGFSSPFQKVTPVNVGMKSGAYRGKDKEAVGRYAVRQQAGASAFLY
jgi:hypothetical protein